jgi:hypothetical protein
MFYCSPKLILVESPKYFFLFAIAYLQTLLCTHGGSFI